MTDRNREQYRHLVEPGKAPAGTQAGVEATG